MTCCNTVPKVAMSPGTISGLGLEFMLDEAWIICTKAMVVG